MIGVLHIGVTARIFLPMTEESHEYTAGYYARDNARPASDRPVFALGELGRQQRADWDRGWQVRDAELRRERGK
jgi:hypothetical protein